MNKEKKIKISADLKEKLKTSVMPISAYFFVEDRKSKIKLFEMLDYLNKYGIPEERISKMKNVVETVLGYPTKRKHRSKRTNFTYDYNEEKLLGFFEFRHFEDNNFEAELKLPGPMAAEAEDLFNMGFWTAFMPFAYYD